MKKMESYTTENGTKLYYRVYYDLGGFNYFTDKNEPRCYSLSIQRNPQEVSAFSDLTNDCGAVRLILFEVGRKSKKQLANAESMALDKLKEFLTKHYSNL